MLPNFRSVNDANGASRPVTIYNEKLPLGSATVANAGAGYQYGTYVDVEVLNGSTADYGNTNANRAKAIVNVGDQGTITSVSITSEGDYYPSTTGLTLISGTGSLSGDPTTTLNFTRSLNKTGITLGTNDISNLTYTKTASWTTNATFITVTNGTSILAGMEVTTGSSVIPVQTWYVAASYNPGSTTVPLVSATGVAPTTGTYPNSGAAGTNVTVTFRYNHITIPAGSNVSGITKGMTVAIGATSTIPAGTVVLSNYSASDTVGPVLIPISKTPTTFTNQTVTFSITGTQGTITTTSTKLDLTSFSLNGLTNAATGYCVLYRNALNGIEFIAMFFNNQGVLVDCIPGLSATDILHLSRTEMFAQAL